MAHRADAQAPEDFAAEVRASTDATIGGLVREGRSSYAAAVFVQNGRVAFSQAYGLEAPGSTQPFSIDSTVVDLNSIRKIFTAAAIAQLVTRGAIGSLDDPMNRYLIHFKLPLAFGSEVTIRQVATHSAGFDEVGFGAGSLQNDPAQFFAQRFAGYFENTSRYSSYDSFGPRLLAYMVGEVSGKPYSLYIDDSILRPLGMNDTHLAAPSTPLIHRVIAYQPSAPANREVSLPLKPVEGATLYGSGVSTMGDMGKFLVALVGPAEDQTVITQPMRDQMFRVLQANGEHGSAHGLLFDALRFGSKTLFVHGGVGPGTRCMMAIDLSRNAGLFYCYGDVRGRFELSEAALPSFEEVSDKILQPFIRCSSDVPPGCPQYPPSNWKDSWSQYLGFYISYSHHRHGFSRLRTLIHPTVVRVERSTDGIRLDGSEGFTEISPGVFGNPSHLETFSFLKDAATNKVILSISDRPSVYERPSLWDDPRVSPRILAILVVIALSGGLIVVLPTYGISSRVRLATLTYAVIVAVGVLVLFSLRSFGERYYFIGARWPLDVARVCAFLTIPACVWLAIVTLRTRLIQPSPWSARLGLIHLRVVFLSSVLLVLTLIAIEFISFTPIT